MSRIRPGFGAIALVSVAIAGCGGGGDDDTTAAAPTTTETPSALSKAELIAQGDAICAEVNAAVGTVGSTSTDSEGQTTQVADLYSGMVERLEGLGAPSEESAGYDEFIGAAEVLAQAQSDVALAAARGEEEGLSSAEAEASAALTSFRSAAGSFGFSECGEAPSPPATAASGEETPASGGEEEVAPEEEAAPEEAAPEEQEEAAPESGGVTEEESAGGGAAAGGTEGGGESSGGGTSGGIGPG